VETQRSRKMLLVDDHALFRQALSELIRLLPDMQVVGSVGTVAEALQFLQLNEVDLVLLDYDLGDELAFNLLEQLPNSDTRPQIVILSAGMSGAAVRRLLASGVVAIVWKHTAFRDFVEAIREPLAGKEPAICPSPKQAFILPTFTDRQRAVARSALMGFSTKEIAGDLGVTDGAVKCTFQQLFAKTGTRSRPQLVRFLLERCPDSALTGPQPESTPVQVHRKPVAAAAAPTRATTSARFMQLARRGRT